MIRVVGIDSEEFESVDISEVVNYFKDRELIQVDSETSSLDPHTGSMICIQLGDYENQFVINPVYLSNLKELLETKTLIFQNSKFDIRWLYKEDIWPTKIYDTFLAEHVLYCGIKLHTKNLKDIAKRRLDVDLDKKIREDIPSKGLTKEVIEYAANDVKYLELIKDSQYKELVDKDLTKVMDLENEFVLVLSYIEFCGLKLDKEKWKIKIDKDKELREVSLNKLNQYVLDGDFPEFVEETSELFSCGRKVKINWNSPKQVIKLFKSIGIDTKLVKDGKEKESVQAKNINKYKDKHPIVDLYLKFKEVEKECSTYGESFFEHINPVTGRIHTNFNQIMDTGRLSSGGHDTINFQSIPAEPETRGCFISEPGNNLVIADYSGQESVIIANKSMEPNLLEFYDKGLADMHSFVAKKMYPELEELSLEEIKTIHKAKRQEAKGISFSINYGGNGATIANNVGVSMEKGYEIEKSYFKAFPLLKDFFEERKKQAFTDGYVLTDDTNGRKAFVHFWDEFKELEKLFTREYWERYRLLKKDAPDSEEFLSKKEKVSKYFRWKGIIERMAQNYSIQASAAGSTKWALIYVFNWIKQNNLLNIVKIVNVIHDEIILECPEYLSETCKVMLEDCMLRAGEIYCKRVKLSATGLIAKHWVH